MSRYIERVDNLARFVGVNLELSLGGSGGLAAQWAPLVYASGDEELFNEHYDEATQANVVQFLLFDRRNPNSLFSSMAMARENARVVRDTVSVAGWHKMNRLYIDVKAASLSPDVLKNPQAFLDNTLEASQTLLGIEHSTISHGEAWNFSRLGRLLERADKTSRILDVKYFILLPNVEAVGRSLDVVQWSALLQSSSALAMYRRKHGRLVPARIVEFLILDRYFPRSLYYCVSEALTSLRAVTSEESPESQQQVVRALSLLVDSLNSVSASAIIEGGLHEFIDRIQLRISQVSEGITNAWFRRGAVEQAQQQQQ